jgi:diguanylate cyclase (GGDEF)-like protein
VLRLLAAAASVVAVPMGVYQFVKSEFLFGICLLAAAAVLIIDAIAVQLKRPPPLSIGLMLIPGIAGMAIAFGEGKFFGAFWPFPIVLILHFAMPRAKANLYSMVLLVATTFLMQKYFGGAMGARFFLALGLNIVVMNLALNIIDSLQQKLIDQAIHDPLTGAFNRRHMDATLENVIERHRRTGASASVLMFDVDHFKHVNDQLGHAVGDHVLKELVRLVTARVRKLDMLFRAGGEEFLLLLPDTREEGATVVAETLRAMVADAPIIRDRTVTVSIGVGELEAGESIGEWLMHTDAAMYAAKNGGRNRVVRRTSHALPKTA